MTITEGNSGTKNATFTVTRKGTTTDTITVNYSTADNTATAGNDYTATSGTLTFDTNETTKTITVPIIGDTTFESDETFLVYLTNPSNATITDALGIGTITDDDNNDDNNNNDLSIEDLTITEGNSGTKNATFIVTRTGTATNTITVNYSTANNTATAGNDYTDTSGTLTFATNETTKTITVPIIGDTTFESDETFFVNLTNPSNATITDAQGIGTITNDDDNNDDDLSIEDLTITEGNSGTKNATFIVTRTGTATNTITVNYSTANDTATAGNDYADTSGTLTFATNETTKTITVPIISDTTFESDETFFVNLSSPSNATITDAQGIGTITNDDNVPTVSVSDAYVSVNENQNTVIKFRITLSNPSNQDVTIAYSTSDNSANSTGQGAAKDYQSIINGTVTFASGETTKEIEVTVFGERGVSDQDLEIFAKDTAYRNWVKGQDVDQIPNLKSSPYGDLGYSVDQVFNDTKSDFQAVGLTSNEVFSLKLTSANNATIVNGDATGTIYDLGKAPILATRGTKELQDVFSDANPLGVGFDQYIANQNAVETWLKKVSQLENGGVIFRPNLTGHSLGGALTQLIASNYTGNLGKVVTFNSPGITSSGAPKAGITSTTHYITSSDIVSMAGSDYLPGSYVLSSYPSGGPFGVAGTHLLPMLSSQVGYDSTDLAKWQKKPTPLSQIPNLSSSNLSNFYFTYLPDPDYFAFQVVVALGSPKFAKDLTFRGTTEQSRVALGKFVSDLLDSLDRLDNFPDQVISSISKVALNAAKNYSSSVWNQIIQRTKNILNPPFINIPQLQTASRSVNAFALSISDVSSDIPSDVSSDIPSDVSNDIPINVSNDIPINVSSDIPINVSSDIPSDVSSDVPINVSTDIPSDISTDIPSDISSDIPINISSDIPTNISSDIPSDVSSNIPSDVSPWDSFSKWTVGIWEASPEWDIQTFSDAIANINTPPGVENPILDQVATEDKPFSLTFAETTFIEIDSNDSLVYSATLADDSSLPTWLSFDPTTRSFLGTPTNDNVGALNIKVTATDKAGQTVSDIFTITVENVNDVPVLKNPLLDQTVKVNSTFTFKLPQNTFSDPDAVNPYKNLVIFGDSLSDTGNAYKASGNTFPPSPNYQGRLSNGLIWVDYFAPDLQFTDQSVQNYAFFGANTGVSNTFGQLTVPGLLTQIQQFKTLNTNSIGKDGLYVIWAGANDFLNLATDPTQAVTNAVTNISSAIATLAELGAKEIVVGNLTDLGALPGSIANNNVANARAISIGFNAALNQALTNLEPALNVDLSLVDIFGLSTAVQANPANYKFTNITQPLITATNPVNPDQYAFWDDVHPTTRLHQLVTDTFETTLLNDGVIPDLIKYSATLADGSNLPDWLNFNSTTRTFSGTPNTGNVGKLDVKVIATDKAGATVNDIFTLAIENVNNAPTLTNAIADQNAKQGTAFNFQVPTNTFTDIDAGDVLTYSATLENGNALPTWLTFNSANQTFSGTPTNDNVGNLNVKVAATDKAGATVNDIFVIAIENIIDNQPTTVGTPGDDKLVATPGSQFNGQNNIVFTGAGKDEVELSTVSVFPNSGNNIVDLGSGDDTIFVNKGDRAFGSDGNDIFDARDGQGGNRISGGVGDDTFYL
ncbi:MAG: Calx-beta domain-containing protein, partial [Aphanizomenon gracile PMC644.10]|nr:Calx-beta domain-containing protein [Aphanizomenon gracile PMC644.10]